MQDNPSPNGFEQLSNWFSRSITVKLIIIMFLALLLLIPASMVKVIINERQTQQESVTDQISTEWSGNQNVAGPLFTVPIEITNPDGTRQQAQYVHLLPSKLKVMGNIAPETLHRGIYKAVVYRTDFTVTAEFDTAQLSEVLHNTGGVPKFDKSYLAIGISDLRGIEKNLAVDVNDYTIEAHAGISQESPIDKGVTIPMHSKHIDSYGKFVVQYKLNLQGSNNLDLLPLGATTEITISSKWQNPSFVGAFLPDNRIVNKEGFSADWRIYELNRNFPQAWRNEDYNEALQSSAFGIELMSGTEDYQKSMRSVKYAILTIGLTFLLFFLIEIMNKKRIHPFQYILVGFALCLFYILLISLSEQLRFNTAYLISASIIILMITLYSRTVFGIWKLSGLLALILTLLYTYLFVTIQISDYALLLGSIGLTAMLAITMYATRKIKWYGNE